MSNYNYWKMMDKVVVAVKTAPDNSYYGRTFNGYVADANDKDSIEKAKNWARSREYDYDKKEYTDVYEPDVHTFDNGGFTVKILKSAGGSSQGGRLSFLACEVEKDGVKFVIGVNDALLVDLIRNSEISKGVIKEKVMFVRKGGQPGFIHEGMDAYAEASADMKKKADLKAAKKTTKWEIGGVYSTLTQTDICIGEIWDTMEEVEVKDDRLYYRKRTELRKREKPVKVTGWLHVYRSDDEPHDFTAILKEKLASNYLWFSGGKPPARAKAEQLEVEKNDLKLIDQILAKSEHGDYGKRVKGRYVRELKGEE